MIKNIKSKADEASRSLGMVRGFARDYRSDDPERKRNTHLLAIAPNASSSIICGGVSPSIEPIRANAYNHKTMSGSFLIKNEELEIVLGEHGLNTEEVWKQIITDGGSVRNVEGLTDWERDVFKTAMEIEQGWIIEHAGMRAPYICQAQSVNLFVPADVNIKYLHDLHMSAWKKGVKSLYYLRSEAINRAENVSLKIERQHLVDMPETCLSCEG
jgi:ribonucleoside-diphosphate reductase alpha chain